MASFMTKVMAARHHLPHGTAPRGGWKGVLLDKGERYGAAFAFGAAKGYYGERFIWKGHGIDLWAGVGLTLGSAVMRAWSYGGSRLAPHMERIGDAGVMSALGTLGASWGLSKAGRTVAVLTPGKNVRPGTRAMGGYAIGAIGPAPSGPFLSAEEIANYAARR